MSPQSFSDLLQTLGNGCLWIRKQASLSVHRYQEFCSGHHATIDGIHLELDRPPGMILGTLPFRNQSFGMGSQVQFYSDDNTTMMIELAGWVPGRREGRCGSSIGATDRRGHGKCRQSPRETVSWRPGRRRRGRREGQRWRHHRMANVVFEEQQRE